MAQTETTTLEDQTSRECMFRLRQRDSILLAHPDPLINHLPEMPKNFFRIIAMNSATHELRALADVTLVFVGPIYQVLVSVSISHSDNFLRSSFSC